MAGFDGARDALHKAGNEKDSAMLGWMSIVPFVLRNHWDAALAVLVTRYFYGADDLGWLQEQFSGASDAVNGIVG